MTTNESKDNKGEAENIQEMAKAILAKRDELEKQWMSKRRRHGKTASNK